MLNYTGTIIEEARDMERRPRVLVSACLLGAACRYDGKSQALEGLQKLLERCEPIPLCPEQLGGLPTPRTPSERRGVRVVSRDGADVTAAFTRGAEEALLLAKLLDVKIALLKARSPSCGSREIYDGSFTGRTIPGQGVTAEALAASGIAIYDENALEDFLEALKGI